MNLKSTILCLLFSVSFAGFLYYLIYANPRLEIILLLFIATIALGVLAFFSKVKYSPLKLKKIIYQEKEIKSSNKKIGTNILLGALIFIIALFFIKSLITKLILIIFIFLGLIISLMTIFGKSAIIMSEKGFIILDSMSRLRNKLFKFYRKNQKIFKYSELEKYSLEGNTIRFDFKPHSLPKIGEISYSLKFSPRNPERIIKILNQFRK